MRKKAKKIGFLILFFIVSLYGSIYFLSKTYYRVDKGWYIQPGDVLGYSIYILNNSETVHSLIDVVFEDYKLDSLESDVFSGKFFRIKFLDIQNISNLTIFIQDVISFKSPIKIARLVNNTEREVKRAILPFAVPVGYWDDFIDVIDNKVPNVINFNYEYDEVTDEHRFNLIIVLNGTIYKLWIVWDDNDGILQALRISTMYKRVNEMFDIRLSKEFLKRERSPSTIINTIVGFIFSFFIAISLALIVDSIKPQKRDVEATKGEGKRIDERGKLLEIHPPSYWLDKFKEFELIWAMGFIVSLALGLLCFEILTKIPIRTKIQLIISVSGIVLLPMVLIVLVTIHARISKIDKFIEKISDFVVRGFYAAYLSGIVLWLISRIIISGYINTLIIGLFAIFIFILIVTLLWMIKNLRNRVKESLNFVMKEDNSSVI